MIQVGTARADVPAAGHGIASVREAIGTTVTAASGNRGFVMATDHAGRYVAVTAWSDDTWLAEPEVLAPQVIADVEHHLGVGEPTVEVFDLSVSHVVKTLRIGHWGQLTRIRVTAAEADLAAHRFLDTFVPGFERDDGLAGVSLLLDRESGSGYTVEWFDSLTMLRGSCAGARESRGLLHAALPTLTVLETVELQVVIVEPVAPPGRPAADDQYGVSDGRPQSLSRGGRQRLTGRAGFAEDRGHVVGPGDQSVRRSVSTHSWQRI